MHQVDSGRIVVTGGAGFIGSALIWALNRRGIDDILVVDILDTSQKWKNLVALRFQDYLDAADFERRAMEKPRHFDGTSVVFHFGACSSTLETDAAYLMRNNFQYTKNLAHWAVGQGIRFVYASSAATYGALEENLSEERELSTLRPLNMYAYSKHLFDCYAQRHGLFNSITGLKFFNIFGPNEGHKREMRSLVSKAYGQIHNGESVQLFKSHRSEYADGEQQRDFLYVKDAVDMTLHLAERPSAVGLFNIGSGQPHTWLDLIGPIFTALGLPSTVEFIDMPALLRDKYQYRTCASIGRLREAGFTASVTNLQDAVTDYVCNYLVAGGHLDPGDPVGSPQEMVNQ